jgi:Ca2+-binding EF-hand superfamily protein
LAKNDGQGLAVAFKGSIAVRFSRPAFDLGSLPSTPSGANPTKSGRRDPPSLRRPLFLSAADKLCRNRDQRAKKPLRRSARRPERLGGRKETFPMQKTIAVIAGFAALAGAAGLALAQDSSRERGQFGMFQADSNNDGVLTRQEFDAGRDTRFARLDADNNGQLTREEMRAMRGEHADRGDRHGRHRGGMHGLRSADANNDGNITRDEFLAGPLEHFNRLDADHNGVISTAEMPRRSERSERGDRSERRASRDANGDRQISREEFASMGSGMFDRLDTNNDGQVTREEAQAVRPHRRGRD